MTKNALAQITSDVNVGIDEVVSVFVTQYEDNLFSKKKKLSTEMKRVKSDLASQEKRLKGDVDKSKYDITIPVLNLVSKVESVSLVWKGEEYDDDDYDDDYDDCDASKTSSIIIKVEIKDKDNSDRYNSSMGKTIKTTIGKKEINLHNSLTKELEGLSNELTEVMGLIKSVSRKERQVRGRISEKKLKSAGFEGLLNDKEMLKLVQLD